MSRYIQLTSWFQNLCYCPKYLVGIWFNWQISCPRLERRSFIICDDLHRIVNIFAAFRPRNIYCRLRSTRRLEITLVFALANRSLISCQFYETHLECRSRAINGRLKKIAVTHSHNSLSENCDSTEKVFDVSYRPYNRNGYSEINSSSDAWGVILDYMERLRFRVERAFDDSIELVKNTCIDALPRATKTSNG